MVSVKELKSIDLSSYTIICTAVSVLLTALISVAMAIGIMILAPDAVFYNFLATRLRNIKIELDGGEIVKISPTETATLVATIALIQVVLAYLVSVLILPLFLSTMMQTLIMVNQALAYSIYQILMLITQPMTIVMIILGTFVITFVFVLIGAYIYNLLASKGRGIVLELSEENGLTAIDSIDMMRFAIVIAIISVVATLITGIIGLISGGNAVNLIINIISSLISGFVVAALMAIFYNFLAPKLGKLKIELIDS